MKDAGNEVKGKAAVAAPNSPYADEIAQTGKDLDITPPVKTETEESATEAEKSVPEQTPEPEMSETAVVEEKPVIFFSASSSNFVFWVKQSDVILEAGLRKRDPGCRVDFHDGFAFVYPSKVYYDFNKVKIIGAQIIEMMRRAMFCGNTFGEFRKPEVGGKETADQAFGRMSGMTHDEVKGIAKSLHLRLDPELTREGVMIEIVKATCK